MNRWINTELDTRVIPFFLWEITRHSIPGMSAVVSGHVRPTEEQLKETMQLLDWLISAHALSCLLTMGWIEVRQY